MLIGLLLDRCKVRTIDVKLELELPRRHALLVK